MPHPGTSTPGDGESSLVSPVLPSANAFPEDDPSSSSSASKSSLLRPNSSGKDRVSDSILSSSSSASSSSSSASAFSSSQQEPLPILPPPRQGRLSIDELRKRANSTDASTASGAQVDLRIEEQMRNNNNSSQSPPSHSKSLTPPKGWLHFVAGGVGGMCGGIITAPLDVVKTRLQSNLFQQKVKDTNATAPKGALGQVKKLGMHFVETGHLLKDIATKEGPSALFKGLGPTLVGAVPARAINFASYGNGKILLAQHLNNGKETPAIHLAAAGIAGLITATATNPIWVVKTRLQLESSAAARAEKEGREKAIRKGGAGRAGASRGAPPAAAHFSTISRQMVSSRSTTSSPSTIAAPATLPERSAFFKAARSPRRPGTNSFKMVSTIVKNEGIKGLYKGLSASYLGIAEGTIQWVLYEYLKRAQAKRQALDDGTTPTSKSSSILSGTVGPAGVAKFTAALITYPHEVIRTRLRQQSSGSTSKYTGLLQTIKLVWKEEGLASFYGGLSAHLLRVVPNAAVMFTIYELTLRFGSKVQQDADEAGKQQQQGVLRQYKEVERR